MKKRLKFKCWNCDRKYTLFKEITDEQVLIVECPFCKAEGVVNLNPYWNRTITVLRQHVDDAIQPNGYECDFPDVIPSQ